MFTSKVSGAEITQASLMFEICCFEMLSSIVLTSIWLQHFHRPMLLARSKPTCRRYIFQTSTTLVVPSVHAAFQAGNENRRANPFLIGWAKQFCQSLIVSVSLKKLAPALSPHNPSPPQPLNHIGPLAHIEISLMCFVARNELVL